jgi:hypothetical protein
MAVSNMLWSLVLVTKYKYVNTTEILKKFCNKVTVEWRTVGLLQKDKIWKITNFEYFIIASYPKNNRHLLRNNVAAYKIISASTPTSDLHKNSSYSKNLCRILLGRAPEQDWLLPEAIIEVVNFTAQDVEAHCGPDTASVRLCIRISVTVSGLLQLTY